MIIHLIFTQFYKYNLSNYYNNMENVNPTTLPKDPEQRQELVKKIQQQIAKLQLEIRQNFEDRRFIIKPQKQIEILKLRIKLVLKCGQLSLLRLNHLEQVFKHYCTHVFRTGKYMTFQRLEYEKMHMSMEKFFMFLKDFDLITAQIQGRQREIIQKTAIITIFKKVSPNARELSFQEFIQCIQKLAILYWDEKQGYNKKQQMLLITKQKRKKLLEKRKRIKQGKQGNSAENSNNQDEEGRRKSQQVQNEGNKPSQEKNINNQNDNLIEELMNSQNIEDPNEQVRMIAQRAKKQNAVVNEANQAKKQQEQQLLRLTNDQKIQFYYQKLDIDSIDSYKHKFTILDLPIFIQNDKNANKQHNKALSESKLQAAQIEQEQRLQKIKAKMNEKKQKFKDRPIPRPSNEKALLQQQKSRRRRQMKKQRQQSLKQTKVEQKKKQTKQKPIAPKIEYKDGQVNWDMLQKMNIQHLKLKQFNPSKFISQTDDDRYFLYQYGAKPRISSRIQARQRQSMSIVESTKMRAEEIQKKQKQKQRGAETSRKITKQVTSFSRNKI